jgi:hypothetical protein
LLNIANRFPAVTFGASLLPRDIQQREKENPNDVDKVPVQADTFDALHFLIFCRV